jgi:hypothetical protein
VQSEKRKVKSAVKTIFKYSVLLLIP